MATFWMGDRHAPALLKSGKYAMIWHDTAFRCNIYMHPLDVISTPLVVFTMMNI